MKVIVKSECIDLWVFLRPPLQKIYIFVLKVLNLFETADILYESEIITAAISHFYILLTNNFESV